MIEREIIVTWGPIIHLQGYASMVKAFKESHENDVERLTTDRRCESESKEVHALKNAPKHTVLCMKGLTSPVWTMGMFQMVTGDSCQCMKHTKQCTTCDISVRYAAYSVRMWICLQISEHVQSGESLCHNWN